MTAWYYVIEKILDTWRGEKMGNPFSDSYVKCFMQCYYFFEITFAVGLFIVCTKIKDFYRKQNK